MEKYGFVCIWYDRKHKRYYIGCRWGNENDGYICSSKWMKDSYKRRSDDFKRKILKRVYTDKKDLLKEEYRWLHMIKGHELGLRYYNLHNHHFNHWSACDNRAQVIDKLKYNTNSKGRIKTPEEIEKLRKALTGKVRSIESRNKQSQYWKGRPQPQHQVDKRAESNRGKIKPKVTCPKCGRIGGINAMKLHHFDNCGIKRIVSDETKQKMRLAKLGKPGNRLKKVIE